jgi:membrane-bound lytic murein transglycosylase
MRRLLAAAALAALCATAAACGSDSDNPPGGSASTTTGAAATTTAAASGNTKQVCTDAEKVITDSTAQFTQELTKAMTAAASGDKSASTEAVTTVKNMFTQWANGLRAQADKATDSELKAALNDTADEIAKVANEIKSMDSLQQADKLLDSPELEAANKKIESICG